jgi:DNA-binding NtrC family response regulator
LGLRLTILVVDDEARIREVVCEILEQQGHQVRTAADGREAARMLDLDSYHLVLSDIHMPNMDGMALLDHVIARHPGTRVMLFTGYGSISNAVEAMKRGAIGYITKPVDFEQLSKEIDQLARDLDLSSSGGQLMREMIRRYERGLPASDNARMNKLVQLTINRIADSEASVLVRGESGTGKELMAALMHQFSSRRQGPFIRINAAAIPESLLESELFGHVKGAFTGADQDRRGRIAEADGGTLFLDEVGEMSPAAQSKLLRVLQEREVQPVGSVHTHRIDIRLITATNRDLSEDIESGRFRRDLYYRLNVLEIKLPPLRERLEDLPGLVDFILGRLCRRMDRKQPAIEQALLERLKQHDWPGNIRELENLLERLLLLSEADPLGLKDLPADFMDSLGEVDDAPEDHLLSATLSELTLDEARECFELGFLKRILEEERGNVSACARRLGIARKNLQIKLKKHGLDAVSYRSTRIRDEQ